MQGPTPATAALPPALDLLTHRFQDSWSVDRLAQTLGVSTRTLHRVFMRRYGMSPMSLLRQMRLSTAKQRLEAPQPGTTVTTVALDCGFAHLGRFSQDYARQFGESPSETLRRARRRSAPAPTHGAATVTSRVGEHRGAA